jgi:ribosomal protein S18 acetylase RimI-like enzyme
MDKFTRDLTAVFTRQNLAEFYANKSVILIMEKRSHELAAFLYGKHLVRRPYSSLYYMGVDPRHRGTGLGRILVERFAKDSPHGCVQLVCDDVNPTNDFYRHMGFSVIGSGASKKGVPFTRWELKWNE